MADFANTAPYGRGICLVCVREFNLKKDGTVRSHGIGIRIAGGYRPQYCSGGGERPRAIVEGSTPVEGGG